MTETLTLARPYAKALYDIASQESGATGWLPIMELCHSLDQEASARQFLSARNVDANRLFNTLKSLAKAASIETLPRHFDNFIALLGSNGRIALLPSIAGLFIEAVNRSNETVVADIVSAQPIDDSSYQNLIERMKNRYGKTVQASISIDESLIGGVIIKIGDTVIDGSVRGRLEQLNKALN